MGNVNWVCFDCRTAIRRPGSVESGRCSRCGAPTRNLGFKIRIPPSRAIAQWRKLREDLDGRAARSLDGRRKVRVRTRHAFEKELVRLRSKPANKDRAKVLRDLEARIRELAD